MKAKHYEDDGDLNMVIVGNRMLVACTAGPHAWSAELVSVENAEAATRSELADAVRDGALAGTGIEEKTLLRALE